MSDDTPTSTYQHAFEEVCGNCGGRFQSPTYEPIIQWRTTHHDYHPQHDRDKPQKNGSFSDTERTSQWDYDTRPIGF